MPYIKGTQNNKYSAPVLFEDHKLVLGLQVWLQAFYPWQLMCVSKNTSVWRVLVHQENISMVSFSAQFFFHVCRVILPALQYYLIVSSCLSLPLLIFLKTTAQIACVMALPKLSRLLTF